jgi:hypothetical protein
MSTRMSSGRMVVEWDVQMVCVREDANHLATCQMDTD